MPTFVSRVRSWSEIKKFMSCADSSGSKLNKEVDFNARRRVHFARSSRVLPDRVERVQLLDAVEGGIRGILPETVQACQFCE